MGIEGFRGFMKLIFTTDEYRWGTMDFLINIKGISYWSLILSPFRRFIELEFTSDDLDRDQ